MLRADATRERFRLRERDFTRERVLTFARVAAFILRGHKLSLQNTLNKCFSALGQVFRVPSASAYCQARQKLAPELFAHLNTITCTDFYQLYGADGEVASWRGHRLVGADGTYLNLPDTEELRAAFTVQRNQHGAQCVQALAVVLHDLRNDLGLAAAIGPVQAEKNLLFAPGVWGATQKGDVLVLDRNSADYLILARAAAGGREVILRCPRQSFSLVNQFWQSQATEQRLTLPAPPHLRRAVRGESLPEQLPVRLLKFTLESGETEVLLTTLCNGRRYPTPEFYQVYGWRWSDETFYGRLKNIFEVERFSGFNERTIKQDFFGILFLATLESVLVKRPQAQLAAQDLARGTQTRAQVNRAVSYVALVERVVALLADPRSSPEVVLEELHHLFQTNPKRQREGRKFERPKLKHSRKLRFHRYIKRVIA